MSPPVGGITLNQKWDAVYGVAFLSLKDFEFEEATFERLESKR